MAGLRSTGAALVAVDLTLAALVVGSSAEAAAPASVTLVVGAPTSLTPGDAAVRSRLQGAGYTVTVADDDTVTAAGAGATTFTIVTSSINNSILGSRLSGLATPLWVAKPYSFDDYGLAGPIGEVDYGSRAEHHRQRGRAGHPLAAGRSGTVTIQSGAAG